MVPELHTSSTTNYPNGARIAYVALASAQPHAAPPFTQLATGARTSVEPLAAVGRAAMAADLSSLKDLSSVKDLSRATGGSWARRNGSGACGSPRRTNNQR